MQHVTRNTSLTVLAVLAAPLLLIASDQTNFTGSWKLDPARSPSARGATVTVNIKQQAGTITYDRSMKREDGKVEEAHFTCSIGKECVYDENGHKAKVSFWFDGPALMILKTKGPKDDATTERKLSLSPDGKTLNIEFTNLDLDKSGKPETLVFVKQPPLTAAVQ